MNERLDNVRRRVARNLDEDAAKDLKGKKFILLRNEDSLDVFRAVADLEGHRTSGGFAGPVPAGFQKLRTPFC